MVKKTKQMPLADLITGLYIYNYIYEIRRHAVNFSLIY